MTDDTRATMKLSVNGGPFHRRCIALVAEIALEKGWSVRDPSYLRGEGPQPDFIISRDARFQDGAKRHNGTQIYFVEIVHHHDPRPGWTEAGYHHADVLPLNVSGLTLDQVAELAEARIP